MEHDDEVSPRVPVEEDVLTFHAEDLEDAGDEETQVPHADPAAQETSPSSRFVAKAAKLSRSFTTCHLVNSMRSSAGASRRLQPRARSPLPAPKGTFHHLNCTISSFGGAQHSSTTITVVCFVSSIAATLDISHSSAPGYLESGLHPQSSIRVSVGDHVRA